MPDIHEDYGTPDCVEMEMMHDRMMAFIFPNTPRSTPEAAALEKACVYQIAHEKTIISQCGDNVLPQGTESFRIGDFQMSFDVGAMSNALTRKTICSAAYGVLLRAGLLYKGVERAY